MRGGVGSRRAPSPRNRSAGCQERVEDVDHNVIWRQTVLCWLNDCVLACWFLCGLQEVWSRQQQLRDRELKKLTERVQKLRDERERLSEEVKQLRDHNYSLMANINTLSQEKSSALLANRDLQIEVS